MKAHGQGIFFVDFHRLLVSLSAAATPFMININVVNVLHAVKGVGQAKGRGGGCKSLSYVCVLLTKNKQKKTPQKNKQTNIYHLLYSHDEMES